MCPRTDVLRTINTIIHQSSQIRPFTSSTRLLVNPLSNLSHFSAAKEAQFLSKERKLPREEFHPHLQLIRSSEVDPFAPVAGASPEAIASLKEAARGASDEKTTYKLAITNLVAQLEASRAEVRDIRQTNAVFYKQHSRLQSHVTYIWLATAVSLPVLAFYLGHNRMVPDVFQQVEDVGIAQTFLSTPLEKHGEITPHEFTRATPDRPNLITPGAKPKQELSIKLDDLQDLLEFTIQAIAWHIISPKHVADKGELAAWFTTPEATALVTTINNRSMWPPAFLQIWDDFVRNADAMSDSGSIEIRATDDEKFRDSFLTTCTNIMKALKSYDEHDYVSLHSEALKTQLEKVQMIAASIMKLPQERQTRLLDDILSALYPMFSQSQPRSFLSRLFWVCPPVPLDRGLLYEELKDLKAGKTTLRTDNGWLVISDNHGFRIPLLSVLENELHRRHNHHEDKSNHYCLNCQRRAILTGKEVKWISRRAAAMAEDVTGDERAQILESIPAQRRAKLASLGLDPVATWCRFHAAKELQQAQKSGGYTSSGMPVPMVKEVSCGQC